MSKLKSFDFFVDPSGLVHYTHGANFSSEILGVAKAVLSHKKPRTVAWFWWNGFPVPIEKEDTPMILCRRWRIWYNEQKEKGTPLTMLALNTFKEYANIH